MGRAVLISVVLVGISFAFKDSDLDGVEDSVDRCPDTPILQLVDRFGCPIEVKRGTFYVRLGGGFFKDGEDERTFSLFSLAYSYGGFYASFTTRYYVRDSGVGDSSLFLGYSRFFGENLYLFPGVRFRKYGGGEPALSPSLLVDYLIGDWDLFIQGGYTFRTDPDLRDTYFFSVGGGYELGEDIYGSLSYDVYESAVGGPDAESVSLFVLYNINESLYTTLSYSAGVGGGAPDHFLTVRLGVRF